MKNNQLGRSMIEMLGVLAIIGVLSVGGIAGYSNAMHKLKVNKTTDILMTTTTNLNNLALRGTNGINVAAAKKFKAIPDEALSSGNPTHPFGGSIDIGNITGNTKLFYVALNSLPRQACIDIATKDFGDGLVFISNADFSADVSSKINITNPRTHAPICSSGTGYAYCLKKVIPVHEAAAACNCTNTCSLALISY